MDIKDALKRLNLNDMPYFDENAGLFNDVYNLGDQYFLKIYQDEQGKGMFSPPYIPPQDRCEISYYTHHVLENASYKYLFIPKIVKFSFIDGLLLMEKAPGDKMLYDRLINSRYNHEQSLSLMHALAEMHNKLLDAPLPKEKFRNSNFKNFKLNLQYDHLPYDDHTPIKKRIMDAVVQYKESSLCMIHGDLNSRNIIISDSTQILSFIDFDQTHYGDPIYDLSYILSEIYIQAQCTNIHAANKYIEDLLNIWINHVHYSPKNRQYIMLHLYIQVLYRFLGPSRKIWTGHIDKTLSKKIIEDTEKHILNL